MGTTSSSLPSYRSHRSLKVIMIVAHLTVHSLSLSLSSALIANTKSPWAIFVKHFQTFRSAWYPATFLYTRLRIISRVKRFFFFFVYVHLKLREKITATRRPKNNPFSIKKLKKVRSHQDRIPSFIPTFFSPLFRRSSHFRDRRPFEATPLPLRSRPVRKLVR